MVFLVTKVVHGRWLCMGTAVFAICTHACIVCVCMCGFEWEIWMSLVFKLRIDYICYCGAVHYLPAAQSASAQPSCFNWQRTYIIQYIHTIWMQKERERETTNQDDGWMLFGRCTTCFQSVNAFILPATISFSHSIFHSAVIDATNGTCFSIMSFSAVMPNAYGTHVHTYISENYTTSMNKTVVLRVRQMYTLSENLAWYTHEHHQLNSVSKAWVFAMPECTMHTHDHQNLWRNNNDL